MKILTLFFFLILTSRIYSQQDSVSADTLNINDNLKTVFLSVYSEPKDAKIFLDTLFIGISPVLHYKLQIGTYKLKAVNPNPVTEWQNGNIVKDIVISGDTAVSFTFRHFYFLNTNPFGAQIFKDDSLFGTTPFRYFSAKVLTGNIMFSKKGYADTIFNFENYNSESGLNINLKKQVKYLKENKDEQVEDIVYKNQGTQFKTKRNIYAILGLGAASVAGAYFTYNYKDIANEAYDNYLLTGNKTKLDESNKNDTYFVISLVFMQAAVTGLIYFLFFD